MTGLRPIAVIDKTLGCGLECLSPRERTAGNVITVSGAQQPARIFINQPPAMQRIGLAMRNL